MLIRRSLGELLLVNVIFLTRIKKGPWKCFFTKNCDFGILLFSAHLIVVQTNFDQCVFYFSLKNIVQLPIFFITLCNI